LIYELLTGVQLFNVYPVGNYYKDSDDDDHLLELNDVIESLPESWLSKWPRAHKYFGPNRERLVPEIDEDEDMEEDFKFANGYDTDLDKYYGEGEGYPDHMADEPVEYENAEEYDKISLVDVGLADEPPQMITNDSLEVQFNKTKPDDIDSEEAKVITELIRKILRYEPSERPTAAELLQHSWFQD
jgi:non-specific serine/threonine protein kinase